MKLPPPGHGRLFCAVLAACYGILAVAATGPHAHDLAAKIAGAPSAAAGAALSRTAGGDSTGPAGRAAHCGLCTWSRATAWPAAAADTCEIEPPSPARRAVADGSCAESPLVTDVLLRAPPQA